MKVLHIAETDMGGGGASIATHRLHKALSETGIDSKMLVLKKNTSDASVMQSKSYLFKYIIFLKKKIARIMLIGYKRKHKTIFTTGFPAINIVNRINKVNANIVHLHWVSNATINIKHIHKIKSPIVWTLHDMWPFTGGCHHAIDCKQYEEACGNCPELSSEKTNDISAYLLNLKQASYKNKISAIVTPSNWLAEKAKKSTLFKNVFIQNIPNPINTELYRINDKKKSKLEAGFSDKETILVFGASNVINNPYKGWEYFLELIQKLDDLIENKNVSVIIFGNEREENIKTKNIKIIWKGYINEEIDLINLYQCADLAIITSTEDNFPNIILESMACATPCIAFDVGGIPEMIEDNKTGVLITPYNVNEMAEKINRLINKEELIKLLGKNARQKTEEQFSTNIIANQYLNLYQTILNRELK